ncbi:magnesium transporter CorA family protein [Bacillus sp. DJP31]|uniref:magnesium transporter CorA family protein n=1 Tax=Bacillus sp. DJP31 TaxID=3409789 RepID=UPI003BB77EDF
MVWIHFSPSKKDQFTTFIQSLDIHPLSKEGLLEFSDIAKIDVFKNEAIISLIAIQEDYTQAKVTILVGENYVVSKEDENINLLYSLKEHFRRHSERMSHPGKILFKLFDKIISADLTIIDRIADEIQTLEKRVFVVPFENEIARDVYRWKVTLHNLRQAIEAQESVMEAMKHSEFPYMNEDYGFYFKSLMNNYSRVVNAMDTFKENLNSIFNLQMTLKADHSNATMKTLTLVSVIFIPMTFIAGLYGMNFEVIPELKWKYGYFYA